MILRLIKLALELRPKRTVAGLELKVVRAQLNVHVSTRVIVGSGVCVCLSSLACDCLRAPSKMRSELSDFC